MSAARAAWLGPGFLALTFLAHAASPVREPFTAGLSGWQSSGSPSWTAVSNAAGTTFGAQGFYLPETAILTASNAASGGAFTGNHQAAGLQAVGFDFLAVDMLPLSVTVEWASGTNLYFRSLPLDGLVAGTWRTYVVNLESKAGGPWSGGTEASFQLGRTNVTQVRIRVDRNGTAGQRYRIDNVFLALPPRASTLQGDAGGITCAWSNLVPGVRYRCEGTSTLGSNDWIAVTNFTAAAESAQFQVPATTAAPLLLRLTGE